MMFKRQLDQTSKMVHNYSQGCIFCICFKLNIVDVNRLMDEIMVSFKEQLTEHKYRCCMPRVLCSFGLGIHYKGGK